MEPVLSVKSGPKRVMVVDDERFNLKVIEGFLKSFGHEVVCVTSGAEALQTLDGTIDLVLLDIMMPDLDGFAVAERIRLQENKEALPIIMVTALSGKDDRLRAVQCGANDFIAKPVDKTELKVRMDSLFKMKEYHDQVRLYQTSLEEMVDLKTRALSMAVQNLTELQRGTIEAHLATIHCLSAAAEYKDDDTAMHIQRMSHTCALLARKMGLPDHEVQIILHSSPMHDIGKIGIPDAILLKPGKLDASEWEIMKTHTRIGAQILSESYSEYLEAGKTIAMSHHERFDGTGYPEGLAGEAIPLYGRISAVADVFDALVSRRPYKPPYPLEKSLDIMRQGRGAQFDPDILDLFFENVDEVQSIRKLYQG